MPTLNDVHIPVPLNTSASQPVSKPWTTEAPPPPARNWPQPERELCARVANQILAGGGTDEEAVLGCISAVQAARQKVGKANYSKAKCMLCKEKPPQYRVLWNGGKNEAWMCKECFDPWFGENWEKVTYYDKIGENGIPKRYRIKRTVKETKVNKDDVLTIGNKQVSIGELIKTWLEAQVDNEVIAKETTEAQEDESVTLECQVIKADSVRHTITGVVLQPDERDSQGDMVSEDDILDAIHGYMMRSRSIDHLHKEVLPHSKAIPVEVYAAPIAFELIDPQGNPRLIKKGAWVQTTKILDMALWKDVEKGELRAYSIKGLGKRSRI